MAELHDLSIADASDLIAARKLSPLELVEALIQRVEQYDAQLHAFITRTFDLARKQAREAEAEIAAGRYRGALPGVALRHRRAHADVRPGEPGGRHHQLLHVRSLRAARAHRR